MALVLKGAVWEGFRGEGNLEDICLKEKKQGGCNVTLFPIFIH